MDDLHLAMEEHEYMDDEDDGDHSQGRGCQGKVRRPESHLEGCVTGLLIWSSKPGVDSLVVWASKLRTTGLLI